MSLTFVLPLVAVAATQPHPPVAAAPSIPALERLVADGLRDATARGFTLAGIESDDDTMTFVVVKGRAAERHVATLAYDQGGTYRVEQLPAPATVGGHPPDELLLAMLHAPRGGLHFEASYGYWYEVPYVTEAAATGAAAGTLVATTLASVDDLESVRIEGTEVIFDLSQDGDGYRLVVELDASDAVVSAELRRFEYPVDEGTYGRRAAMRRALERRAVTAIHDRDDGVVLVTDRGEYEIDPFARAFVAHPRDPEEGCGC